MLNSYPCGLGRSIGEPKAKVPVNKSTLKIDLGGVDSWMDDGTDLESPFNYKSIETIKEDSCGAIFVLNPVKTIINVRG
jgi:hypothetical protein